MEVILVTHSLIYQPRRIKIISILFFITLIMFFSKCSSNSKLRYENHDLQKELVEKDSINTLNEGTIRILTDSIKDLNFKTAVDKGSSLEGKHDIEIKLMKCEKDNLRIINENNNYRRENINLKAKIKQLEKQIKSE